jgi:ribosomal protein S18 acetylase RimI-like enzyme
MDSDEVRAAFDEQVRRHPEPDGPGAVVEAEPGLVRLVSPQGWGGVTWTDLDASCADAVIAAQVERFTGTTASWEWKHYSYDQPADLADRLLAAGFSPEPPETLMVAEIAELALGAAPPDGVRLVPVVDAAGVSEMRAVHEQVFGGDHERGARALQHALEHAPGSVAAVVAMADDGTPVAAGRIELHRGTDFASLWGGGTLPAWRGRGIFRAMVAQRARIAAERGFRYLQVDASPDSRPILGRLGFAELATTTPFVHAG